MTTAMNIPDSLEPVRGPFEFERVDDGVASLGPFGITTRSLVGAGVAPPDLLMGMTLALLAGQPRAHRAPYDDRASPIEGGVWVREQVTIHRPVRLDERWTVNGGTAQRFVRKGRRYGVTVAETVAADGEVLVSNRTTGLLSYQADEFAVDAAQAGPLGEVPVRVADRSAAIVVERVAEGLSFTSEAPVEVTLALMQRRDGRRPLNPIHSDPERARKAGLAAPIAGGSHIAAFVFEVLMRAWGAEILLHGANIDIRWTSPTFAGEFIEPRLTVTTLTSDLITLECVVDPAKLRGIITIPRRP